MHRIPGLHESSDPQSTVPPLVSTGAGERPPGPPPLPAERGAARLRGRISKAAVQGTPDGRGKVYGVTLRYGLDTLMAVTTAFAALFALLVRMGFAPWGIGIISLYLVLVGLGQMVLWRGREPRLASVVAGTIAWPICALVMFVIFADRSRPGEHAAEIISGITCVWVIAAPIFGYLAGGIVAGVYLVLDRFEDWFKRRTASATESGDADPLAPSPDRPRRSPAAGSPSTS